MRALNFERCRIMTFRLVFLALGAFALTSIFISLGSGNLTHRVELSAIHRYELFTLFLYFSTVVTVLKSAREMKRPPTANKIDGDDGKTSTLFVHEKFLILFPSIAVILFVFTTA